MEVTINQGVVGKHTNKPGAESQPGMENHRAMCLCWQCDKLKLGSPEAERCPIARMLYAACCAFDLVTPVVRCGEFEMVTQ